MPASASLGPALWLDGCSWAGPAARAFDIASRTLNTGAAQVSSGVLPSGGALAVTAGPGMSVNVATGYFVAASSVSSVDGGYLAGNMSAAAGVSVATSDPANPRIDAVYAWVQDLGTSSSDAFVQVFSGTPTSGATLANLNGAPASPGNAVLLANLLVPASSASVSSGNISDQRSYTVAQGGILPVFAAAAPAGYTGQYFHDLSSGTLKHNPPSGAVQAKVLPFAPQHAFVTTPAAYHGGTATLAQVTGVNTDGNTDIEIYCALESAVVDGNVGDYLVLAVNLDSTRLWSAQTATYGMGVSPGGCGTSFTYRTRSGVDRPSSGSHTVTVQYSDTTGSSTASHPGRVDLYVRAVSL
jgi:hypothetical protein